MRYQEEKALERKEAFDEGRDSQLLDDIKGMLTEGLDIAAISRITGKAPAKIQELIDHIQKAD